MRAVNLIPAEERRGAGGAAGRSGGAVHVLLGLLAAIVLITGLTAMSKRSATEQRGRAASLEAQAVAAEAQATSLASYTQFAGLRAARSQTVTSLAASRFDWAHALKELARVIPSNVSLTGLQGTVAPGVSLKSSAGGSTGSLRAALPAPAIELSGCTGDQDSVARMLTRMRLVDGVSRVALQSSTKASAGTGTCTGRDPARSPAFALVVFFDQATGGVPTTTRPAATPSGTALVPTGTTGATGATGPTVATTGVTP